MSNNYIPTTWIGAKTVGTADVMNNIEQGIGNAHDRLDGFGEQFGIIINELDKNNIGIITPKMFNGNDFEKLQQAIDYIVVNQNILFLDRMYDITGYSLKINKGELGLLSKRYATHIQGGGIIKNDSGFIFTSDKINTSDLYISNVFFESTGGSGTQVYDCDKLIRLHSNNCQYSKIDKIAQTTQTDGFSQSLRFMNDTITGGRGYAFTFDGVYDTVFDNVTIEQRESGIKMLGKGVHGTTYGLRITNSVLEGLADTAIYLENSFNTIVENCYFEANKFGNIVTSTTGDFEVLTIKNCGSYGSVTNYCDTLVKIGGRAKNVDISHCVSTYGLVCDATSITSGIINFAWNRGYLNNKGENNLIITGLNKFNQSNGVNKSYFGMFTRLQKSINQAITIGVNKIIFEFNEKMSSDDVVSIQIFDDRIDGYWFYRNGTTIIVNIKSSSVLSTIPIVITVLKPNFTITG